MVFAVGVLYMCRAIQSVKQVYSGGPPDLDEPE